MTSSVFPQEERDKQRTGSYQGHIRASSWEMSDTLISRCMYSGHVFSTKNRATFTENGAEYFKSDNCKHYSAHGKHM